MSCGNCQRDSQREIFQRGVHIYFCYYKQRFLVTEAKKKVRKSSAKTDKNVHNLKKKKKSQPKPADCAFFFIITYMKGISWVQFTKLLEEVM